MNTTLSADVLWNSLRENGWHMDDIHFMDSKYVFLDDAKAADFFETISGQVRAHIVWEAERSDCDKFARFTQALAQLSFAMHNRMEAGLAVGTLGYLRDEIPGAGPDQSRGHAINILITKIRGQSKIKIRTFEPQTGEEVFLTKTEKRNLLFILW